MFDQFLHGTIYFMEIECNKLKSYPSHSQRVLLGPQEISGYYKNLEKGFLQNGVPAKLITTHPHPFDYGQATPNPRLAFLASNAVIKHREAGLLGRLFWASLYMFFSFLIVFWSIPRFDVFVFAWGTSFLPFNLDIPVYRLFGKKVFVILGHGSEARPPYMSTPPYDGFPKTKAEVNKLQAQIKRVARSVRRNERLANRVIGMQMTAQFLTKPFIDFYRIGLPSPKPDDLDNQIAEHDPLNPIVVLHVPSNKAVKGTDEIRIAMERIIQSFPNVEYRELSGVGHSEILAAMANSDIVLDWLWSDIPMAVVGTEAAGLSKPTIISSYGWEQWERWEQIHGKEFLPPVIRATPETLGQVIHDAISEISRSKNIGFQAHQFISKVWTPSQVASNFTKVISGNIPESWIMTPEQVDYLWGAGVSRENTLNMVRVLLASGKRNPLRWAAGETKYLEYLSRFQKNDGA
ncbi:hypothetical protein [Aurantimicrobium minutum]|uniref:hypothetical protein n=1 Tax=Aurantimicrobium minutum TaxID=708131 RepID=UPI0024753CB6|nr:hypothetical protein [Aurantimicrobium minutum]MDH6255410.1 hypothetical protein [Aurantimicrobium minutum]